MPWTIDDVERHKKGLTERQKRQWVRVANSVLERCLKNGGDQKACEATAIKQANGVVGKPAAHHIQHNNYTIRRSKLDGRQYIIVPVVMIKEGVHNGSAGPILHTREELAKVPAAWNGIPVTVSHPKDPQEGTPTSANQPPVVESMVVGRVYNTQYEDGKLKAEAWLDEEKLKKVSPVAYAYIMQQRPLDVSVGVFSEDDYSSAGDWNGEKYIGVARNYRPDHLALLPGEKGACSWEDGCGVRVNVGGGSVGLKYSGKESTPWTGPTLGDFGVKKRWKDLSQSERARIAGHFLIGDANAEDFSELKFPVVNPKTGKLNEHALRAVISGRGAQVKGVSAAERARARRKAYELLNKEFGAKLKVPKNLTEEGGSSMDKIRELLKIAPGVYSEDDLEWLETLEEAQVDKLLACAANAQAKAEEAEQAKAKMEELEVKVNELTKQLEESKDKGGEKVKINKEQALQVLKDQLSDKEVLNELLSNELKEQIAYAQKLREEHRKAQIEHVLANQAEKVWDEEALKALSDEQLEKLAKSIKAPADYSVAGLEPKGKEQPAAYGEILMPVGVVFEDKKE